MLTPRCAFGSIIVVVVIAVFAGLDAFAGPGNCWQMTQPSCCDEVVRLSAFQCVECPDDSSCCDMPVAQPPTTDYAAGGHEYGYQQSDLQQLQPYGGCLYYPAYCDETTDPQCRHRTFTWALYCQKWFQNSQTPCTP